MKRKGDSNTATKCFGRQDTLPAHYWLGTRFIAFLTALAFEKGSMSKLKTSEQKQKTSAQLFDTLRWQAIRISSLTHGASLLTDSVFGGGGPNPDEPLTEDFFNEIAHIIAEDAKEMRENIERFEEAILREKIKLNYPVNYPYHEKV